ncbi:MAG: FHIPEP family type III secretion protein [Bdellovibrionales bacterium]|nr:FHIPEP family type III secretion protein [Bdellovibrionales bacterium]
MAKGLALRKSELFVSLFVFAIALLLLVPLPTPLLDLLLVLNLGIALFLLLVVLYISDSVRLLAFPTLLLLTTLFRLGLNVASTRLILSQGDAGEVIEAFGTFLVGGEILVGVVVFAIITIINLIVIARGASRISEVAARFALDSLPGKQMSIDADLRAGLISPQEAEKRREQLRKESQLYGAMDGAMKFVQGDAIAGIVIIFTNVIGGLSLGLVHGMGISDALRTYTVLTIGDGLVSQIPAFLIAICAGLVVTRISASKERTLGGDLQEQLFDQPVVLLVVGILLGVLAWIDGMPKVPFLLIALLSIASWVFLRGIIVIPNTRKNETTTQLVGGNWENRGLPFGEGMTLAVDSRTLLPALTRFENELFERWQRLSREAQFYFGGELPMPRIEGDSTLARGAYELRRGAQVLIHYEIPPDAFFLPVHPRQAKLLGFSVLQNEQGPILGGTGCWVAHAGSEVIAEAFQVPLFTWLEFAGLQLFEYCRREPGEVVSMSELHAQLKELENSQPGLISQSLDQFNINLSRLTNIVHQLLREGLPYLGLHRLIENISTYYSAFSAASDDGHEFDIAELTFFIRGQNRQRLLGTHGRHRDAVRVISISREAEKILLQSDSRLVGATQNLGRESYQLLRSGFDRVMTQLREKGVLPVSVECPEILRVPVFHFLQSLPYTLPLVCEEELELQAGRTVVAVWNVTPVMGSVISRDGGVSD